jgi:hypothetical protein
MTNDKTVSTLLDIMEGIISSGEIELSGEELDDYVVCSVAAHKSYGRKCPLAREVSNDREGACIADLVNAGLSYEDYQNAIRG